RSAADASCTWGRSPRDGRGPRGAQRRGRSLRAAERNRRVQRDRCRSCSRRGGAKAGKEIRQQLTALVREHAAQNRRMVVQARLTEDVDDRTASSRLWIARAKDEPCDARMQDRTHAHRARLERHIKRATGKTIVAKHARRIAQRRDFGVRRRVVRSDGGVAAAADDRAILDDDRANGHLAARLRRSRENQRLAHVARIVNAHCQSTFDAALRVLPALLARSALRPLALARRAAAPPPAPAGVRGSESPHRAKGGGPPARPPPNTPPPAPRGGRAEKPG